MSAFISVFFKILDIWLGSKIKDAKELARQREELQRNREILSRWIVDASAYSDRYRDALDKLDAKYQDKVKTK
jgi:hypothetical protein